MKNQNIKYYSVLIIIVLAATMVSAQFGYNNPNLPKITAPSSQTLSDSTFVLENSTLWAAINNRLELTDQRFNDTALILSINTTSNIMSLGFYNTTEVDDLVDNSFFHFLVLTQQLFYPSTNPSKYVNLSVIEGFNYYNSSKINETELEEQGDGKLGIIDSFINLLIDNRITQSFIKTLGFYDTTEVYNKTEIDDFNYYNLSDFDINDYRELTNNIFEGNISVNGNVTADYYFGDGSQLTGISTINITTINITTIYPRNKEIIVDFEGGRYLNFTTALQGAQRIPVIRPYGDAGKGVGYLDYILYLKDTLEGGSDGEVYVVPGDYPDETRFGLFTHTGTDARIEVDRYSDMIFRQQSGSGAIQNRFKFITPSNQNPIISLEATTTIGNITWVRTTRTISFSDMIQIQANRSAVTCDSAAAGTIYYNGVLNKHYGCNSTTWNAMY